MVYLDDKQRGVAKGMALGAIAALFIVFGPPIWLGSSDENLALDQRFTNFAPWILLPTLVLFCAIAFIAKYRFFNANAIDGDNPAEDQSLRVARAFLQNTSEQVLLFALVSANWIIIVPYAWLWVIPIASITFVLGRVIFAAGYAKGAPSRAFGFAAPFYASVLMLLVGLVFWLI